MADLPDHLSGFDWSVTTWEGSRREQLRAWSRLSFDEVLAALEEMEDFQRDMAAAARERRMGRPNSE